MPKKETKKRLRQNSSRQLLGFVLLLLALALLLYTSFVLFEEGSFFKVSEDRTAISKQDEGMTSVSIVYKRLNSTNYTE